MESLAAQAIDQLSATGQRLAMLDDFGNLVKIKSRQDQLADSLLLLHHHLRQLDRTTIFLAFEFNDFDIRNNIITYSGLMTEYKENIADKIDFLLDIGSMREGPDKYTALYIEEQLNGIAAQCQAIDTIFAETGLLQQ
jgi:hypothetical protein